MDLRALGRLLESEAQYQRLRDSLRGEGVRARVQVLADAIPFVLATLQPELQTPMLLVTPRPDDARQLHDQLVLWSGPDATVLHFPETETLPFERLALDVDTTHQRLRTLTALCDGDSAPIVVASTAALTQKTISKEVFLSSSHTLERGQSVELDELMDRWRRMGYQFEAAVYGPGFASRRGGILDIYPVGSLLPARIELWGNEIDSIRTFDPSTQRSSDQVDSIHIGPAQETLPDLADQERLDALIARMDTSDCTSATRDRISEELGQIMEGIEVDELTFYSGFFNQGSLLDFFSQERLTVLHSPLDISEAARDADERTNSLRDVKERRGELPSRFPSSHLTWGEVEGRMAGSGGRVEVVSWGAGDLDFMPTFVLPFLSPPAFLGKLDSFVEEADELAQAGNRVVAATSHSRRLGEILSEYGVKANLPGSLEELPPEGSITVLQSDGIGLTNGFVLLVEGKRLAIFSDAEIFGVTKQRRVTRRVIARRTELLSDLSPGDYVVHVEHGIGRFAGTGPIAGEAEGTEYLILSYAQGDKLYVPMDHLDRVTPYLAPMERPPRLTRLGTGEWKRTKARVERSTREMAAELLSLYAAREMVEGHSFSTDLPWQAELEESFPYEETPDQIATIAEVKADMEADKPMDRLVCGDVGYGKTEIALRAAFKSVMDGRQVAVLVPTTVLAQQHYVTFSQRLSAFPTRVEVLSRFRTDKEQREIVQGLADGTVDICIGTHRLIQKDVRFKDLGLVVIDEEQRFGVAHKERLKQMRREVDVLTLTATPIPRTLHMSLAGVRDMSTMETHPEERLPIKTYVSEYSDELIREAILRELDRQGQVYFLHNRVHNIEYMAEYIRRIVPEAKVGIAHGQMPENQLEQTMLDFSLGKMDVLLCTTIIESGLDIPNVNTLMINRADAFGLAQLYQLRGRVGRSARRAYAYLLVPRTRGLTDTAQRRLRAMLAATELGAGFRIAMKDLEIRGAGNILGAEQSGQIHAVGFDLYTRLLGYAVEELRARRALEGGEETEEAAADRALTQAGTLVEPKSPEEPLALETEAAVDLGIPASLPPEYISDMPTRIGVYQRLVQLDDLEAVGDLGVELEDRFGTLPWQAQNLLYIISLKLLAKTAGIGSITVEESQLVLRLKDDVGGARPALQRLLGSDVTVGHTQLRIGQGIRLEGWEDLLQKTVERLAEFRERLEAGVGVGSAG